MSKSCSTCEHWFRKSPILSDPGMCRRYPPTTAIVGLGPQGQIDTRSFFPQCTGEHLCGEYKAKLALPNDVPMRKPELVS